MPISPYLAQLRRRIGHDPVLMPAVTAVIFDDAGRVLLHCSRDDGRWYLIGGAIDPGEQPAAAVAREVLEETGLAVEPLRIVGVYSEEPMRYPNGDVVLYVTTAFVCRMTGGSLRVADDESTDVRFFGLNELPELLPLHRMRIERAASGLAEAQFVLVTPETGTTRR